MKKTLINIFIPSLLIVFGVLSFTVTQAQEDVVSSQDQIERQYKIGLIYTQEEGLKIDGYNTVVSVGEISPSKDPQDFLAKLYSFQDEVLIEPYFSPEESEKFDLKLPYYPTGKTIKVFNSDDNTEILEINIQVFAQVCGDNQCQGHESYESCEQDCLSGGEDDFCDQVTDGTCDPDCKNIKDFDSDCTGDNPATIAKELREKMELDERQNIAQKNDKPNNTQQSSQLTKPSVGIFTIAIVVVIVIVSILIFFLLKKDDK